MNLKLCLALLFSIALMFISGCKSTQSLSKRRVPAINQEYLDGKRDKKRDPPIKGVEGNYYGFNSHHIPVNYFEEKPSKEIFHAPPKKMKKKKPVKIYKKLPKKGTQDPKVTKTKKVNSVGVVKVKPKGGTKVISYKGIKSEQKKKVGKDKKNAVRVLKPSTKVKKEVKAPEGAQNKGNPKYNPIHWPKEKEPFSKLSIEKDVAYLKQDLIKKDQESIAKLKPKNTKPRSNAHAQGNGKLDTYDVESKPIPLPFK